MIPLRDDNPSILPPRVTLGLITLNVLSWVFLQGMGTEPMLSSSVCRFALVPGEILGILLPGTLFQVGPDTACQVGGGASWPVRC